MSNSARVSGRLLEAAPPASRRSRKQTTSVDVTDLASQWNDLQRGERRQIRRLVRIGQPQESREDAELAVQFAAFQRSRAWFRFFWLWIVPLTVAGVIAGFGIHPLVIGLVLGAAVSALMVRRNFTRVEKVNAKLLGSSS